MYTPKKFVKSLAWCLKQRKEIPGMSDEVHLLSQVAKVIQTKVFGKGSSSDVQLEVQEKDDLFWIYIRGQESSKGIQFFQEGMQEIEQEIGIRKLPFVIPLVLLSEAPQIPSQASQEPLADAQAP